MSVVEGKQRICCFLVFADHLGSIVGLANGSAWGSLAIRDRSTLCPLESARLLKVHLGRFYWGPMGED